MHDLVVRQRQHEVLAERVHQAEGELVVVVAAVDRILLEVAERVVHPAHVPLEAEAEAAEVGRPRHARPGRGLLGDRHGAGVAAVDHLVELLEERDRVEVLAPAELVRQPLALLARVVEVEHRGHGVDAQAVDVVLASQKSALDEQEVAHLVAAVVEDQRAPVRVLAAARVGVLVERGAVEAGAARSRRAGSAPAPSRGARRCRCGAAGRRTRAARPGCPSRRRARSSR